ncbi:hypothetical protein ACVI1K_000636 [Bradyrhizobium sp. USDA 4508]
MTQRGQFRMAFDTCWTKYPRDDYWASVPLIGR